MGRFVLLPEAEEDLARLVASLGDPRASPPARRALKRLRDAFLIVAEFPGIGVGLGGGFRQHTVTFGKYGFVMRYRVTDDAILITRLWHGRQNRPDS